MFVKDFWVGDSKDGSLVNGEGIHYYKMLPLGQIVEAYETYEKDDGEIVVTPLPEMHNVNWMGDLGFENFDALDQISEREFRRVSEKVSHSPAVAC
jgi:hypothetical protein